VDPYRLEELRELGYEGSLLTGILGSTAQERQNSSPRSFTKLIKKQNLLHRHTRIPLSQVSELLNNSPSVGNHVTMQQVEAKLAEVASLYPSYSNLNLRVILPKSIFEGKNSGLNIRSYLIFIHYRVEHPFWRFFFIEPLIRRIESADDRSKIWSDDQEILTLFNTPELLEVYLRERFPDGDSIKKSIEYMAKTITKSGFFISMIDSGSYIQTKVRRKGYNDKGSVPSANTKLSYGLDTPRGRIIYNYDLVDENGDLTMNQESSLKDILLNLHEESLESLLSWIKQRNREKDLFHNQNIEQIQAILNDETLSAEQKIERMMKGEQTKRRKQRDDSAEHRQEERESLRVYRPTESED